MSEHGIQVKNVQSALYCTCKQNTGNFVFILVKMGNSHDRVGNCSERFCSLFHLENFFMIPWWAYEYARACFILWSKHCHCKVNRELLRLKVLPIWFGSMYSRTPLSLKSTSWYTVVQDSEIHDIQSFEIAVVDMSQSEQEAV